MKASPLAAFHRANAVTYLSLTCAIAAIAGASRGHAPVAGALIAVSVIADTFDGRFARLFARSEMDRQLGVQLDSLSDAIAFGVAPALCMTLLASAGSTPAQLAWWAAVILFAACAITRLSFYNVTHEETPGFVGLPAPVAALVWSTLLLGHPDAVTSVAVLMGAAVAMVLPIPVPRPKGVALTLFVLWPIVVALAHLRRV